MNRNIFRACRCLVRLKINAGQMSVLQRTLPQLNTNKPVFKRHFSSPSQSQHLPEEISSLTFNRICCETLESLCEYFEEIVETSTHLKGADVTYGDGVLTVNFGSEYGTYVINRQTPNKQIWLSSPKSGPKRYDLTLKEGGYWIYRHDGKSLHQLLQEEIPIIVKKPLDFSKCSYSLV